MTEEEWEYITRKFKSLEDVALIVFLFWAYLLVVVTLILIKVW